MYNPRFREAAWAIARWTCILAALAIHQTHAVEEGGPIKTQSREQRVIKLARQAILMQLLVQRASTRQPLCERDRYACLGPNGAELGLALLGSQTDEASESALIDVLRFRIDAGLSEDHFCYLLQHGTRLDERLSASIPSKMRAACEQEVAAAIGRHKQLLGHVRIDQICTTEGDITARIAEVREALGRRAQCDEQGF